MNKKAWVTAVLLGVTAGIVAQFGWKIEYYPESLWIVIPELLVISALAISAVVVLWK